MARIRSVKPQLRTSLTVAEWPREVRYFWVLLWGYLDDHGRGVDDVRLIKADCFPLDDDVTRATIDEWLDLMTTSTAHDDEPAVCRYQVKGRRYVHAPKWTDHQKPQHPKPTEIPPCPVHHGGDTSTELHEDFMKPSGSPHEDPTPEVEVEMEVEEGARRNDATPRQRGTRLPGNWQPTPELLTWAAQKVPDVDVALEAIKFRNHWLDATGKNATKLAWDRAFQTWMIRANQYRPAARASPAPTETPAHQLFNPDDYA
jgi:hypothetical protein